MNKNNETIFIEKQSKINQVIMDSMELKDKEDVSHELMDESNWNEQILIIQASTSSKETGK